MRRLGDNAHLLSILAVTFWAANFLVGRAVRADVPPVALAFGRWAGATLLLAPFAARAAWRQRAALRRHAGAVLGLAFLGVTAYNTLVYLGLQTTTALTTSLLQALMPVAIVAIGAVAFRDRIGPRRAAGLAVAMLGAVWVILEGRPGSVASLDLAIGDLLVLVAVLCYAGYSVLLRSRPKVEERVLAFATFLLGTVMLVPFVAWEHTVRPFEPNPPALAALAYVMVFPSIVSYLAFNRAVALIGSVRAGAYLHLMPVLGALGAVALLGERFEAFHAIGVALVASGIAMAATREERSA